jgi:hypothetical protein
MQESKATDHMPDRPIDGEACGLELTYTVGPNRSDPIWNYLPLWEVKIL